MTSFRYFVAICLLLAWSAGIVAQANDPAPEQPSPATAAPVSTPEKQEDDKLAFMNTPERDPRESAPGAGGLLLRTFAALLLIVGLIVAAAWTLKRLGGARFGTPKDNAPELAVLNSLSLGDKRSLSIVRFAGRTILLGSTAQSLTLLAEIDVEERQPVSRTVAELLCDDESQSFADELLSAANSIDQDRVTLTGGVV